MYTNALFLTKEHEGSSYYLLCYKNKMFPIVSYIGYVFKYHTCKKPSMNEISVIWPELFS